MAIRFDPYHKWLGIPPEDQPPHHYKLLSLQPFESDPDVISNGYDQRRRHLKTFATSDHAAEAQDILDQVAQAYVCLHDPERKDSYDRKLRARLNVTESQPQMPEGFWLPPIDGLSDTFNVLCPYCQEEVVYKLDWLSKCLSCRHCKEQMRVPGKEEVERAIAQVVPVPPSAKPTATSAQQAHSKPVPDKLEVFIETLKQNGPGTSSVARYGGTTRTRRDRRRRRHPVWTIITIILGGVIGIAAGLWISDQLAPNNQVVQLFERWIQGLKAKLNPNGGNENPKANGAEEEPPPNGEADSHHAGPGGHVDGEKGLHANPIPEPPEVRLPLQASFGQIKGKQYFEFLELKGENIIRKTATGAQMTTANIIITVKNLTTGTISLVGNVEWLDANDNVCGTSPLTLTLGRRDETLRTFIEQLDPAWANEIVAVKVGLKKTPP